tara:strand:+ start:45 stop:227 length:183 start_codon:yes stop_codon:yes gene_type:complete
MGGSKKKRGKVDPYNKRLDLFLKELEIGEEKRKQIIEHVEDLTWETLKNKSRPKLRLSKD